MAHDPLRTQLTESLGIQYPIVAFTPSRDVVVAVIKGGGFGVLAGAWHEPDALAEHIAWIRKQVDGKPFGLDLLLPASAPPAGTIEQLMAEIPQEHRDFVQRMKERNHIPDPVNPIEHYQLGWINQDRARKQLDVALEERVPVLAFGLGSPNFILEAAHARGIQVWGLIGKPRQAKRELEAGVDAIIAQGNDAAGHTGPIGTFSLVPEVVAIAGGKPVLAAGGVTTGRHLAAALCLGAAGAWTGTLWLASKESDKDPIIKQKLIDASADDTVYSKCMSGFSMRILKCGWTEEWERPDAPAPLSAPYQLLLGGAFHQAVNDHRVAPFMTEACGQGVAFVTEEKSAAQIVADVATEARAVLESVAGGAPVTAS